MSHPDTRAARRALARKHPPRKYRPTHPLHESKTWALLIHRRHKLLRAKRLGMLWPHPATRMEEILADTDPLRVLFVCSRNQWRSPTGERVFARMDGVETRSAGTSRNARRALTLADIRWADLVLVMEDKHASRIRAEYRQAVAHKPLHVLGIPDDYRFMDPELVAELEQVAGPLIASALQ